MLAIYINFPYLHPGEDINSLKISTFYLKIQMEVIL